MKTNALQSQYPQNREIPARLENDQLSPAERIPPRRVELPLSAFHFQEEPHLQMYTEEEVSSILRISLSQLRKWRMKRNPNRLEGPPFKKIGRMVRYPAKALRNYMDCE